jgi:hypothetical protein
MLAREDLYKRLLVQAPTCWCNKSISNALWAKNVHRVRYGCLVNLCHYWGLLAYGTCMEIEEDKFLGSE